MRVISIVGARPQFVKLAPVSRALREQHEEIILHTGQHYDYCMSAQFFDELAIPVPDYHLEVGSGLHGVQTARMLEAIEAILMKEKADWVVVFGDTNSTLAGALAAAKLHIPIAHIEAGLRSFNRSMPEEINRIVTDHLSERLFCPTETACRQANAEGITRGVEMVGDVMYDMVLQARAQIEARVQPLLHSLHVSPQEYLLATVHRPVNTDDPVAMHNIAQAFNALKMPILFPLHPRTRSRMAGYGLTWGPHVWFMEPTGYLDMLTLQQHAYRILTDSGGVQKEAFFSGVPCVTLREETEWMETVDAGWNVLVGSRPHAIIAAVQKATPNPPLHNLYGEGDASKRIVRSLNKGNL